MPNETIKPLVDVLLEYGLLAFVVATIRYLMGGNKQHKGRQFVVWITTILIGVTAGYVAQSVSMLAEFDIAITTCATLFGHEVIQKVSKDPLAYLSKLNPWDKGDHYEE